IHKLMMTSAAYMQNSAMDEDKQKHDPDNRYLWRRPRVRLEAEAIRDAMLLVSGTLDGNMFGPGTLDERSRRRSVYFTVKRSHLIPMLQVFDAPDALQGLAERPTTTIAPQALLLLNNANVRKCAQRLAQKTEANDAGSFDNAVRRAYSIALSRE